MNPSIHEQEYAEMARPLESLPTETELSHSGVLTQRKSLHCSGFVSGTRMVAVIVPQ